MEREFRFQTNKEANEWLEKHDGGLYQTRIYIEDVKEAWEDYQKTDIRNYKKPIPEDYSI